MKIDDLFQPDALAAVTNEIQLWSFNNIRIFRSTYRGEEKALCFF